MIMQLTPKAFPPVATPLKLSDLSFVIRSFLNGESALIRFEKAFKYFLGAKYCYAVSSGRAGFKLILSALQTLRNKREVIIPAYTTPILAFAILESGLKIKICDISIKTLNIDVNFLPRLMNPDTLCVTAVHMFGYPCQIDKIVEIAKKKNVYVIENVAQAAGASFDGKKLSSFGDISLFSLGKGKNFTSYEGGIIVTNSLEHVKALKSFINLQMPSSLRSMITLLRAMGYGLAVRPSIWWFLYRFINLEHQENSSINFKPTALSNTIAALALSVFRRLEQINLIRKKNARYLINHLKSIKGVLLPEEIMRTEAVYPRLPVIIEDKKIRDSVYTELFRRGIGITKMFHRPLHLEFENLYENQDDSFPVAEYVANRILTLPTHPFMEKKALDLILDIFKRRCSL